MQEINISKQQSEAISNEMHAKFTGSLTEEEKEEWVNNQFNKNQGFLSPEQLKLRQKIGVKLQNAMISTYPMSEKHRQLYTKYPMWKFYTSQDKTKLMRAYAVTIATDGKKYLTMINDQNEELGDVPISECFRLNDWSDEQKEKLELSPIKSAFIDPLGWANFFTPS